MTTRAELAAVALFAGVAGVLRGASLGVEPPLAGHLLVIAASSVVTVAVACLAAVAVNSAATALGRGAGRAQGPRPGPAVAIGLLLLLRPLEIGLYWRFRYDTRSALELAAGWLLLALLGALVLLRVGRGRWSWRRAGETLARVLCALLAGLCVAALIGAAGALGPMAAAALALAAVGFGLALRPAAWRRRWTGPVVLAAVVALVVGFLTAGIARHPASETAAAVTRPSIVLITIDTLRRDRLGLYGYPRPTSPAIDRLASEAVVFDQAVTSIPLTNPSHISLMTGLYPARHQALNNGVPMRADVETLAGRLREVGYDTAAFVSSVVLSGRASGLDRGFFHYDERRPGVYGLPDHAFDLAEARALAGLDRAIDPRRTERTADHTTRAALAWLAEARRPFFLWLHYYDPHGPYRPPEPFRDRFTRPGSELEDDFDWYTAGLDRRRAVLASSDDRTRLSDRYDAEIAFTDAQIDRLLARLRASDGWPETVVAVTADHGESLTEHGCFYDHSGCLHDPSVRIPLLLRWPRAAHAGRRVGEQVRLMDLFPTLLELAAVRMPGDLDGRSLVELVDGPEPAAGRDCYLNVYRPELEGDRELAGLRTADGRKLILTSAFWSGTQRIPERVEAYDCAADPLELDDRSADSEATVELLERVLGWEGRALAAELEPSAIDPKLLETLRALGYLGGD